MLLYFATLDMACPKQEPTNGRGNWSGEQDTTNVKAKVKVARLDPSFFTYMITLLSKPNEFNNIVT
jgi:hypothetical protein